MLFCVQHTSSSCTGSFSGEMALAVIERTVNDSGHVNDRRVFFQPVRCHAASLRFRTCFLQIIPRYFVDLCGFDMSAKQQDP